MNSSRTAHADPALWSLLTIHALLLIRLAFVTAPVFDELAHLPAGLSHWLTGTFDLYRVNPPLVRMLAAIPVLVTGAKTDWTSFDFGPDAHPEFDIGQRFLEINGARSFRLFALARMALIPLSLLGGWLCYCWAAELFGRPAGRLALALWCFCPNILCWAGTVMPDLGATVFGLGASYLFWRWRRMPNWPGTFLTGLALGAALLSKLTWVLLFGLWPILLLVTRVVPPRLPGAPPAWRQLIVVLLLGLYVLNVGYGFEGSFQRLGSFEFVSDTLTGEPRSEFPGNRWRQSWIGTLPVPVPANYLRGIDVQKRQFERGKWSYLRGDFRHGGWLDYYAYALAVKTPVGTLALLVLSIWLMSRSSVYRADGFSELAVWAPALAVLALVSSQTGFNRYLRYVLPALPYVFISVSRVARCFDSNQRRLQRALVLMVACGVIESLSVFPHSLSFFNLPAGGPLRGHRHLLDANLDWGQDLFVLEQVVDSHPEMQPLHIAYYGAVDPGFSLHRFQKLPDSATDHAPELKPGWYAVSAQYLFDVRPDSEYRRLAPLRRMKPTAMAGYSIYLYDLTSRASTSTEKY